MKGVIQKSKLIKIAFFSTVKKGTVLHNDNIKFKKRLFTS